ncbi:hypothetical protein GCM10023321_37520 [Pseudonocardia eucalypti]|uniref:DUF3955 domain-containing protein n=1 Tax=Pseudonocardia eucalypti TaxID=648755 RepID=A0ABP9QC25_9PSEU
MIPSSPLTLGRVLLLTACGLISLIGICWLLVHEGISADTLGTSGDIPTSQLLMLGAAGLLTVVGIVQLIARVRLREGKTR